jgi:hypothetical protein
MLPGRHHLIAQKHISVLDCGFIDELTTITVRCHVHMPSLQISCTNTVVHEPQQQAFSLEIVCVVTGPLAWQHRMFLEKKPDRCA